MVLLQKQLYEQARLYNRNEYDPTTNKNPRCIASVLG